MHPMTRSAGMAAETAPSGSSLSIRLPSQGAAVALEVPPRDTVLGRHDCRLRPEKRAQPGGDLREAVGLESEEDEVDLAHLVVVARSGWVGLEVAFRAPHADAA